MRGNYDDRRRDDYRRQLSYEELSRRFAICERDLDSEIRRSNERLRTIHECQKQLDREKWQSKNAIERLVNCQESLQKSSTNYKKLSAKYLSLLERKKNLEVDYGELVNLLQHSERNVKKQKRNIKKQKRHTKSAKRKLRELQDQLQQGDSSSDDAPVFDVDDAPLTSVQCSSWLKKFTEAAVRKPGARSMSVNKFVCIVYAPYFDEAFGKVYVPRIDEILDECHFDEVTDKVRCDIKSDVIKQYFMQNATYEHFAEIHKNFVVYKETSYVLQRLWDMGYHQAKDVVQGLEDKHNIPFEQTDELMKESVFGVPNGKCFVSGQSHTGVGDHIQPVRGNRHITGCYGGNSKWNLAPVISSLNQPYKNIILYLRDEGVFIKVCLDNTTIDIDYEDFFDSGDFSTIYDSKIQMLKGPVRCVTKLRNWYRYNQNIQTYENAVIVQNVKHFEIILKETCGLDDAQLNTLLSIPTFSRRDQSEAFISKIKKTPLWEFVLGKLSLSSEMSENTLKCLFSSLEDRAQFPEEIRQIVSSVFSDTLSLKKSKNALWRLLGIDERLERLEKTKASKHLFWMKKKKEKGLYQKVNAVEICAKLGIWSAYVETRGAKMEWKMNTEDLENIERILRGGVRYIHERTKKFVEDKED
jgi:hypothetical protein